VAELDRFFSRTTRQPAPWLSTLSRWPDRAVLSLNSITAEDREQLERSGLAVAPVGVGGIAGLNAETHRQPSEENAPPYPLAIEEDDSRWLHWPKPKGKTGRRELRSLDRQLRAWLGGNGYRCLVACAVYPGLAWNLTLHLALALIPEDEREHTIGRLVRLPWFRHSRMPQWLREFLTGKLDPAESGRVLELLQNFLNDKSQRQAGSAAALEFTRITEDLRVQRRPPTHDYVFLSFLLHRKPRLRAIEAPGWLRNLLYPEGLPVLGLRREWWLALGLFASGLVLYGAEKLAHPHAVVRHTEWREITSPLPVATEPVNVLAARALEIAVARLGQPADGTFASWSFDRAVEFSSPQGAPKSGTARPGTIFQPNRSEESPILLESIANRGFILIEPFEGRLRRVYREAGKLAGSFHEISIPDRFESESTKWAVHFSDERTLQLVVGDIARLRADAIVNTTNPRLVNGGSGVDAAIHAAGGPRLQKELDAISPRYNGNAPVGTVAVTTAGNLPARLVLHLVGPVYSEVSNDPRSPLAFCYSKLFQEAGKRGVSSMTLPAISTGANGYPIDIAAAVEIQATLEQIRQADSPLRRITIVLFDAQSFRSHVRVAQRALQVSAATQ
jgi:O-acetyl-ADP-ribose deacetylase (regulator of RNase III)